MPPPDWVAYVASAAGLLGFLTAFPIYFLAPSRTINRYLGLLLFFEGMNLFSGPLGAALSRESVWGRGLIGVNGYCFLAMGFFYFLFVGQALKTPLAAPLRRGAVQVGLLVAALAYEVIWWFRHELFGDRVDQTTRDSAGLILLLIGPVLFGSIFGLAAAFSARRRARTRIERVRATAYLVAFGSRDIGWLALLGVPIIALLGFAQSWVIEFAWAQVVLIVGEFTFIVALNYGILRFHLFNLQYGLKLTIETGTLAAIFGALAFAFTNFLVLAFQGWLGSPILGLVAAAVLMLVVAPFRRFAKRIADALVPGAKPVARMSDAERLALYRDQVTIAWEDGRLSQKERRMLEVARRRLGVGEAQAYRVERSISGN